MSAVPSRRVALRSLAGVLVAALTLASCATPSASGPRLDGTPALSISVPLSEVGCTANDACVALGTTSAAVGPHAVAEVASPRGRWSNLAVPTAVTPQVTTLSCGASACLAGGSTSGHDLLWRYATSDQALSPVATPSGGRGVEAVSCAGEDCALIDETGLNALARLSFSESAGASWSPVIEVTWAAGMAISSLTCTLNTTCLVSARGSHHDLVVELTRDAGATWTKRSVPASWTSLTSLHCVRRTCEGLATITGATALVRTNSLGRTWSVTTLDGDATSVACVTHDECLAAGSHHTRPWLAFIKGTTSTVSALHYVPTSLLDVACGSKVCAAIGVTTLVHLTAP